MKHSPFGGSAASRFMACPGSIALSGQAPSEKPSPYAEEGTFAHAVAAEALETSARSTTAAIGKVIGFLDHGESKKREITAEISKAVDVYLEAVWDEFDLDPDAVIEVEQGFALDLDAAEPGEVFGTNDALVYSPARRKLTIFDYKHGTGVMVDVEDNTQLKFYAIGAMQGHPEWDVRETWEPTAHLCFIVTQPDEKRILHQLWQSNIGRSVWRPVVETYATDIESA